MITLPTLLVAILSQISPTPVVGASHAPRAQGPLPAGSPMTETQVAQSKLPTVAPAFGNVLEFAGDRLVVSGACIVRQRGAEGQIATFERRSDDTWNTESNMPQVSGLQPEEFVLQRLAGNADTLVTTITRKSASGELAWFRRTDEPQVWKQAGSIKAPAGAARVNFGGAIAMSGPTLAVSEVSVRPNMKDADYLTNPRVYLFRRDGEGWKAEGALQRDESKAPWWFGSSLAIDGDTLAVGYPAALQPFQTEKVRAGNEAPMVSVYRRGEKGWTLEQDIAGTLVSSFFGFGNRVAVQGDLLAVQSLNSFAEGADVFVYRRVDGRWSCEGQLVPGDGVKRGRGFGFALQVSDGKVIVGDSSAEEGSDRSGRAFVFERRGGVWMETIRLKPKMFCAPATFGSAVVARGPWVAIGRVRNERLAVEPGGVYLYDLRQAPPPPPVPERVEAKPADPVSSTGER